MAAILIAVNTYLCDVDGDRNTGWPENTIALVKDVTDVGKYYILQTGVFNFLFNQTTAPQFALPVIAGGAAAAAAKSATDHTDAELAIFAVAVTAALAGKEPLKGSDDNYVTDAQLVVVGNTSGINSGNETVNTLGATINGAASATPNDTDLVVSVDASVVKKNTWIQIKAFLKTYFDTLYATIASLALKAPLASPTFTGTVTLPAAQIVNGVTLKTDQTAAKWLDGVGNYTTPTASVAITETEIDFGSTPTTGGDFVITNAGVSVTSKIMVTPSGNVATGRVGNDYTWESFTFSAVGGTGNFVLSAICSNGSVVGKRKVFYTFA